MSQRAGGAIGVGVGSGPAGGGPLVPEDRWPGRKAVAGLLGLKSGALARRDLRAAEARAALTAPDRKERNRRGLAERGAEAAAERTTRRPSSRSRPSGCGFARMRPERAACQPSRRWFWGRWLRPNFGREPQGSRQNQELRWLTPTRILIHQDSSRANLCDHNSIPRGDSL